jgi:hypothetical protein
MAQFPSRVAILELEDKKRRSHAAPFVFPEATQKLLEVTHNLEGAPS